ncbi:glycosyltransferase family 4 protein [Paenactinomyces guangxiensis]|uniref:Glycosyltransferase family 4 protein n=1 Tax=Paenactinomyces guangxiensis TaxID=1490290 RepID=A0A7W1WTY0_9BACL|nr:glycosyltransferase family 4 protein [Paenactinomyces guangxiensis]MBA4495984.1 glycosyltransferase family 4 protein [Paenactinomyces guangxiensis]MBH8593029.1 glycosyltransferase family 4 protein [Paenactinomyces guangxiensis]
MSLHVLVISHMYPNPVNSMSGIFVHNQMKALKEAGVRIQVVSPIPFFPLYPKWKGYRHLPRQTVLDGITVHYVPTLMFPRGMFFSAYGHLYWRSIKRVIAEIRRDFPFDLIHCHTIYPDGYAGARLKNDFGVPVISTIHGSDIMLYPRKNSSVRQKTVEALRENDQIITVSERLLTEAVSMTPGIEVQTVYNGFDPARFYPVEQKKAQEQLGIPLTGKKLLFVGNLLPVKAVHDLLSAFAAVAAQAEDVHLYLVGDGPLRSSLHNQAAQLGLLQRVTFMGRRPYEEIPAWINSADAVVLSSLSEGLPSILLETMGCGKAMVATDVGGISEILRDGETGFLVQPGKPEQLSRCLGKILVEQTELLKTMGEKALSVSKQLTWQQNAQNTRVLYDRVLKRKSL